MKKTIRIMGLALVLALLCTSAFAAPSNLSQIEGLPERPDAPTMKTKIDGTTQIATLSAPLASLNAVAGLERFPMELSEDGLTATLDLSTLNGLTIGRANTGYYLEDSSWIDWRDEDSFSASEVEDVDAEKEKILERMTETPLATQTDIAAYNNGQAQFTEYYGPEYIQQGSWTDGNGDTHYWFGRVSDAHVFVYEASPVNGYALAYEGTTADGAVVRYDNYGKLREIIVTVEGQNYLGSEQAPTKSEVYFEQVTAGNYWNEEQGTWVNGTTTYWVVRSIKEYYTDENGEETSEHVKFAYNGSYDGHVKTDDLYAPKTYEDIFQGGNG